MKLIAKMEDSLYRHEDSWFLSRRGREPQMIPDFMAQLFLLSNGYWQELAEYFREAGAKNDTTKKTN